MYERQCDELLSLHIIVFFFYYHCINNYIFILLFVYMSTVLCHAFTYSMRELHVYYCFILQGPSSSNGPLCFDCQNFDKPTTCDRVTLCSADEVMTR